MAVLVTGDVCVKGARDGGKGRKLAPVLGGTGEGPKKTGSTVRRSASASDFEHEKGDASTLNALSRKHGLHRRSSCS